MSGVQWTQLRLLQQRNLLVIYGISTKNQYTQHSLPNHPSPVGYPQHQQHHLRSLLLSTHLRLKDEVYPLHRRVIRNLRRTQSRSLRRMRLALPT